VSVRRLGEADLAAFQAIRLEALREAPEAFGSSHAAWAALPEAEWHRRLAAMAVFASYEAAEPVGLIGLMPHPGPRSGHRGTVLMVYLREGFRGQGRAAALLEAVVAEARARRIRQLELNVAEENLAARRLYERAGFLHVGRLPAGYIHDGREIDEISMVKRLEQG
jgi:ribosomal protein S18 acetylase RimI-like enzyme